MDLPPQLKYEKKGQIAVVTIDRPEAMNALTPDMLGGIDLAMADFDADDELLVAILTASGEKAFCAGMDLKEAMPLLTSGDEMGYEATDEMTLTESKEFTYWLFKWRLHRSEGAKAASDTQKGLREYQGMAMAAKRRRVANVVAQSIETMP